MKSLNRIEFEKFHGNGNDFIFISSGVLSSFETIAGLRDFVQKICRRRFSVGADGVVFYHAALQDQIQILIVNSDGSFASTCGNALRCLGLKLIRDGIWDRKNAVQVSRLVPAWIQKQEKNLLAEENLILVQDVFATLLPGEDAPDSIAVAMGLEKEVRPTPLRENALAAFGKDLDFFTPIFVQLANPHWVFFSTKFKSFGPKEFEAFGQFAQTELRNKTLLDPVPLSNISMITLDSIPSHDKISCQTHWNLTVYERGAGLTSCCGSGATASRIALESVGLVSDQTDQIVFHMSGGDVSISKQALVNSHPQRILQGQVEFVFCGAFFF